MLHSVLTTKWLNKVEKANMRFFKKMMKVYTWLWVKIRNVAFMRPSDVVSG